jgi:hypothetical protein
MLLQDPSTNLLLFKLPVGSYAELDLKLYNIKGEFILQRRQFETVADGTFIEANTSGMVTGIYLYTIRSDRQTYSGKFLKW